MEVGLSENNFPEFISLIAEYITDNYDIVPKIFTNLLSIKYEVHYNAIDGTLVYLPNQRTQVTTKCANFNTLHKHSSYSELGREIVFCTKMEICAFKIVNQALPGSQDAVVKHQLLITMKEWLPVVCATILELNLQHQSIARSNKVVVDKSADNFTIESDWNPHFLVYQKIGGKQDNINLTYKYYRDGCIENFKNQRYFIDCSWILY